MKGLFATLSLVLALLAYPSMAQDARKTVGVGDLTVSYGEAGAGRPVVLVHGGGIASRRWGGLVAAASRGFRVLTPDTRNHGGTDNPSGTFSYDAAAKDLAGFIAALRLEKPVVIGFSDGGMIVQKFLLAHPGVASAAVIGGATNEFSTDAHYASGMRAFYGYDQPGDLPDEVLDAMATNTADYVARIQSMHATEAEPDRWRNLYKMMWPTWTTPLAIPLTDFANIDIPVLVILGQYDDFFLPENALALARALPQGEIAVMPGAHHAAFREQPEVFNAILLNFLGRHP